MLELTHISAGYGQGTVLDDLSLTVEDGEIVGLLGRNGMGKTTLIRVLAGLLKSRSGHLTIADADLTNTPAHARASLGVAIVPQGRGVFPDLTVEDNLRLGKLAAGNRSRPDRLACVLDYFPRLGERPKQKAGTLSGGEQQMLAIGRALMSQPTLLLLDEPSDGIMPVLVQQIADNITAINREEHLTTLIVEQNVSMVTRMTNRALIMERGRIVADGDLDGFAETGAIERHLGV